MHAAAVTAVAPLLAPTGERAPGPASIDLIVPDTMAARRSRMISDPSAAMSFTGSIVFCARVVATAWFTAARICVSDDIAASEARRAAMRCVAPGLCFLLRETAISQQVCSLRY